MRDWQDIKPVPVEFCIRLCYEILNRSCEDYWNRQKSPAYRIKQRQDARFWLFHSDKTGLGSMVWVCEALDIDIGWVRAKIKELKFKPKNSRSLLSELKL